MNTTTTLFNNVLETSNDINVINQAYHVKCLIDDIETTLNKVNNIFEESDSDFIIMHGNMLFNVLEQKIKEQHNINKKKKKFFKAHNKYIKKYGPLYNDRLNKTFDNQFFNDLDEYLNETDFYERFVEGIYAPY